MKTRFSPSPTGQMHLGNVRTALFNALLAQYHNGKFLLRIEDTDRARSIEEYTVLLQEDLRWLGLHWQEGPYWQSQRQSIYDHYYEKLIAQNNVYSCFCSDEKLALSRKIQLSSGRPPRYAGTCLILTPEQIAEKKANGEPSTLRFKVPAEKDIRFTDVVKGPQVFKSDDIGDFIIRRADGSAAFFFCNAIDDAVMGVTHAFRGEDHLPNTPRQILILETLQLPVPQYGHIPLIVGQDGSPLSKRHGSRSVKALRDEGYLPIAINNYLARLGHYYQQNHLMTFTELAAHFSLAHLGNTPAQFDAQQLLHWQKLAVNQLEDAAFVEWMGDQARKLIPEEKCTAFVQLVRPNTVFPKDVAFWANILFGEFVARHIEQTDAHYLKTAIDAIRAHGIDYQTVMQTLQKTLNIKGSALFHPLRMALTGQSHGPELHGIFAILGKSEIIRRLQTILLQ